jgi:hypothetical protein
MGEVLALLDPTYKADVVAEFLSRLGETASRSRVAPVDVDIRNAKVLKAWYRLPQSIQSALPLRLFFGTHTVMPEYLTPPDLTADKVLEWTAEIHGSDEEFAAGRLHMVGRVLFTGFFHIKYIPSHDSDIVAAYVARVDKFWRELVPLEHTTRERTPLTPKIDSSRFQEVVSALDITVDDVFALPATSTLNLAGPSQHFEVQPRSEPEWVPRADPTPLPPPVYAWADAGVITKVSTICLGSSPCHHECTFENGSQHRVPGDLLLDNLLAQGLTSKWALAVNHLRDHARTRPDVLATIDAFLAEEIRSRAM